MLARSFVMAVLILVGLGIGGSLSGAERGKPGLAEVTGPVWPKPPAPARIRFLRSVDGGSDWGVSRNWWGRMVDTLTGRRELPFVRPTSVTEHDGVLYVADPGAQTVVILDAPRHKEIRVNRVGDRTLVSPVAVTVGPQGTVYVADSYLRQVLQLDRDGRLLRVIGHDELQRPSSVAYDTGRGRLYVGDAKSHFVHVFDGVGHKIATLGGLGSESGRFNSPTHLAVLPDGDVAVTDALNFRVQVFDAAGEARYVFGKHGDGAGNFAAPKGVAVDRAGHLYVADAMFDVVQIFDAGGRLLLNFGEPGNQAGQFWIPNGVAIDDEDRLFVADAYNRRIQVFQILSAESATSEVERGSSR
jgi:DNA-binding beta-propeller fold protein YncE